jgi:hypothetical protein
MQDDRVKRTVSGLVAQQVAPSVDQPLPQWLLGQVWFDAKLRREALAPEKVAHKEHMLGVTTVTEKYFTLDGHITLLLS